MKFDVQEWKNRTKENFEKAWHEGSEIINLPDFGHTYPRHLYHRPIEHPVFATIQRLRDCYLSMGFDEICNPIMVDEQDVYRQFGPEAMAVLDRVFYLGGLPRPNVGISRSQVEKIGEITGVTMPPDTEERLRETLHSYKKGLIDGDDLVHAMAVVLQADDAAVVHIMDSVFPEFRVLSPESSRTTLRSHMTSGWFITLGSLWEHSPLPLHLFSVDRCFRREQQEGPTRLMSYHSASCVVAGDDVTIEEGKAVSEALLSAFGFTDFTFKPDEKRSKYYIPGSQTEVYARHPRRDWVEVATFGLYAPSALAEYSVGIPVMNLGLGVERLAMIIYGADDMRAMSYPQFFPPPLTDRQIAAQVRLKEEPRSATGRTLASAIAATAKAHGAEPGPCSFKAWQGMLEGVPVQVFVEEKESNTKLCGPACFNEVYVQGGSILGLPNTLKWAEIRQSGVSTGIVFLDAVTALATARIERATQCGKPETVQVKMARSPADINLSIADHVMRYITDNKKKVDVRGPVFLTIRSEIGEGT